MARRRLRMRRVDLKKTLFLLPNLLTLSSVFCGFYAMLIASRAEAPEQLNRAAFLIVFAMFFDLMDGRVARMTKTQSAFGLQLDSLADIVSFGAAPALLVYFWSLHQLGFAGVAACFVYTACGAIRLARFNVQATDASGAPAKPGKHIVGLPIPPAAAVLVSMVVASPFASQHPEIVLAITVGLGLLMVSRVRFRSFKELRLNRLTVLVLAFVVMTSAVVALRVSAAFVLVWLLGFYVSLGIGETLWRVQRQLLGHEERISTPPSAPGRAEP